MQGAPAGSPARPSCEFLAGERANLHRPLDRDDAAVVVLLRSAADEEPEPAADVPAGALARLEIAEDVQLVGSSREVDPPACLRAERERHPLDLPVLAAERPHVDVANAVLLVLAVAAARTHDVCPLKTNVTSSPGCATVIASGWTAGESPHMPTPRPDAGSA